MAREVNGKLDNAYELYKKGYKLIDIARELNIPDSTVRRWKKTYGWDNERSHKNNERSNKKSNSEHNEAIKERIEINNYLEVDTLTDRQRLFAEIYVKNFNATQAAIKAGYAYSSAFVEGCRQLKNVKVRRYIDYLKNLKKESILVGIDDIVEKQMRIAFADITDYIEFGREAKPVINSNGPVIYLNPATGQEEVLMQWVNTARLKESFEVDGSIIKEVNVTRQGTSIKLHDPQKAMEWLTDFFEENPEHKYKKEFDKKKLQLERERFEHQKEMDKEKNW